MSTIWWLLQRVEVKTDTLQPMIDAYQSKARKHHLKHVLYVMLSQMQLFRPAYHPSQEKRRGNVGPTGVIPKNSGAPPRKTFRLF